MSTRTPNQHTQKALQHLKTVKPYDGWSTDEYIDSTGQTLVRLLRRSVPLTEKGFVCLFHDEDATQTIVGVQSIHYQGVVGRGITLVDADGTVNRAQGEVRVTMSGPATPIMKSLLRNSLKRLGADETSARANPEQRMQAERDSTREAIERARQSRQQQQPSHRGSSASSVASASLANDGSSFTDEQNKQFVQYALLAIATAIIMKALFTAMFALYILLFPVAYVYAVQTCPPDDSFDTKKELKRVLRGANLPDDHPDKPKGWINRAVAKAQASFMTELATGMGYELGLYNMLGACTLASVRVPALNVDCYWLGIFGKWRFIMKRDIPPDDCKND